MAAQILQGDGSQGPLGSLVRATDCDPDHACGANRGIRALSRVFVRDVPLLRKQTDLAIDDGPHNSDGLLLHAWDGSERVRAFISRRVMEDWVDAKQALWTA
jgi:hypothetical protein